MQTKNLKLKKVDVNDYKEYILYLLKKDKENKFVSIENLWNYFVRYNNGTWILYPEHKNIKGGIVYSLKINNKITLDGHRDDKNIKEYFGNKYSYSLDAGKLVTDYLLNNKTKKVYSIHNSKNKGADILCHKIGFKFNKIIENQFGKFNQYVKEK